MTLNQGLLYANFNGNFLEMSLNLMGPLIKLDSLWRSKFFIAVGTPALNLIHQGKGLTSLS